MKPNIKRHITPKRHAPKTAMRPIIFSIASALSLLAVQTAYAKFTQTPPHLQNEETEVNHGGVKPHITLLIDDSGSMTTNVTGTRKTRLQVTKDVLDKVVGEYQDQFEWNIQTLNGSMNMEREYTDDWRDIKNRIRSIGASGGTPTTRRYYETITYVVQPETKYRCQKNYVVVMSDGDANLSCITYRYSSSLRPFRYNGDDYFGYVPRWAEYQNAGNVCQDPVGGSVHPFWDRDGGLEFFSKKLASKDFYTARDHGTDGYGKSWDGDPSDPKEANGESKYKNQLVNTFTIGFSGMSRAGENYLLRGASKPEYNFNAANEEQLLAAFRSALKKASDNSVVPAISAEGTVAPAVTSSGIPGMAANVRLDSGSWSSRLEFYSVNKDTGAVDTTQIKYPLFSERKALINIDGSVGGTYFTTDFDKYAAATGNAYFGLGAAKADEWKEALVPWVIRSGKPEKNDPNIVNTYTKAAGYSQDYRERTPSPEANETRNLGDIIDSPVLTIGGATSDGLVDGRNEFLVTAANDGMVHLFRSHNAANPYSLKLSYIPAAMERDGAGNTLAKVLKETAAKEYGQTLGSHRYLVNGGITVRRTAKDNAAGVQGQQSFLFGAMGQGGRGAYALNIGGTSRKTGTPVGLNAAESTWDKEVPLFETAKGSGNTLGFTVGTPQIGRIALKRKADDKQVADIKTDTRYAGFLSSGFGVEKNAAPETALYVYDILGQNAYNGEVEGDGAGELIHKFDIGGSAGLASPTLVDADFDGTVDVAYAGDYAGNMYRFDMRGEDKSQWTVTKIFSGTSGQPITSAPAISRRGNNKYVVIFGTGSDIYEEDINDKTRQAVYGIYDNLDETPTAASVTDLQEQTLGEVNGDFREITSTNAIGTDKKGWMVKLGAADGERIVVKPTMILRTVVLSTRIYDRKEEKNNANTADLCSISSTKTETSASSWILSLNAETGGKLTKKDAHLKFVQDKNPPVPYAGEKRSGIVSFTNVDGTKKNDSPVTRDGDSGGSGTDKAFKKSNTEIPNNKCFSREAVRVLLTNQGDNPEIDGRICGIRRLSWREIFF